MRRTHHPVAVQSTAFKHIYKHHVNSNEMENIDFAISTMWPPYRIEGIDHCVAFVNLTGGVIGAFLYNRVSVGLRLIMSRFTLTGIFEGIALAKKLKEDLLKLLMGVVLISVGIGMR